MKVYFPELSHKVKDHRDFTTVSIHPSIEGDEKVELVFDNKAPVSGGNYKIVNIDNEFLLSTGDEDSNILLMHYLAQDSIDRDKSTARVLHSESGGSFNAMNQVFIALLREGEIIVTRRAKLFMNKNGELVIKQFNTAKELFFHLLKSNF